MPAIAQEKPFIEDFIDLFLAALVLRGKRSIWVRTDRAYEERDRMYRLHKFLGRACEENAGRKQELQLFLLRLRGHVAPGNIDSFDDLLSTLRRMPSVVDIGLPFCNSYNIVLPLVTAQSYLERADPWLRKLAEDAADAYMAADKKG